MATSKVLAALDALDRHRFDRVDSNNSLDTLYNKIFIPPGVKEPATPVSASGTSLPSEGKENRTEYVRFFYIIYCLSLQDQEIF